MQKGNELKQLRIDSFANEGKCLARHEGKVVFVKGTLPGELVNARITRSKKDWMEAEATEIIEASPDRQQPFCEHFGYCGGCQWQHMRYDAQLRYKQWSVAETLQRLGKISPGEILPIAGCDREREYRNKLEFTFSHREWQAGEAWKNNPERVKFPALGFHLPGAFDRVFDVKSCRLQPPLSDEIRLAVKRFTSERRYEYFHLKKQTGLMRNLMIRIATSGEVMVLVVFANRDEEKIAALMEFLRDSFPEITSLLYTVNTKKNDTIYDLDIITYAGSDHLFEKIGDLKFRISPKSFFQTNTGQAEKLYHCVKDFAALGGEELVYDLYTGTGSIALFLARSCSHVAGIESVPQAIDDARINASLNGITNVSFHVADAAKLLNEDFYADYGKPDVVITDPPRAGMHENVIRQLIHLAPPRLVYVSCNVATQARDLQLLSEKYFVEKIRPFDLFPQTQHIENVALLRLRE
jgi:23S rRNA (uracil1939-C5)-methyltransferase